MSKMKNPKLKPFTVKIVPYDVYPDDFSVVDVKMKEKKVQSLPTESVFKEKGGTLEDLLATDNLFIEYFNDFLQLPTFPEPLFFNKESGGFEVLTDARKQLAKEIKAAVRSGRRRKRIYRATRNHSFSTIPLIPMEEPPFEEEKEIDTSFTVQTLNKEQGIEWIKAHRLPAFLESDCYLEYRLSTLVSQAQVSDKQNEFISMKIDYTPPPRKTKKTEEDEEPKVDVKAIIMKDLFVCMGNASTTDTDAFVSRAQMAMDPTTTFSSSSSMPKPSILPLTKSSTPGRPSSSTSSTMGRDSGLGTSRGGSALDFESYANSVLSEDDVASTSNLFDPNSKPVTPRPNQTVCVVTDQKHSSGGGVAFFQPTPPPRDADSTDEEEEEEAAAAAEPDAPAEAGKPSFKTTDEFGAVIVGTVLKHAVAEVTGKDVGEVALDPQISEVYPDEKFNTMTKDGLQGMVDDQNKRVAAAAVTGAIQNVAPVSKDTNTKAVKIAEEDRDSDNDSVLNSDEDYEGDRDVFFRKKKARLHKLHRLSGIEEFKTFLIGTIGERNWNMWVDIERVKIIKNDADRSTYLALMRQRYQQHGAAFELSSEMKSELGLTEPTQWTLDKMKQIQNRIAEPLVLYWAPRFMIKQKIRATPEKHFLYYHQQLLKEKPEPHPNPPTIPLLPLRPKTCMPRFLSQSLPTDIKISDAFESMQANSVLNSSYQTTPPVGFKRVHALDDSQKDEKDKNNIEKQKRRWRTKTPKQLITPKLLKQGRPPSAPVGGNRSSPIMDTLPRPASAEPIAERKDSVASSNLSDFVGGRRMEGLLQALANEKKSGGFLKRHLDQQENQLWKNALAFWLDVQDYHNIFYSETLHPVMLEKKAKYIYSTYVVVGAPLSIRCNYEIKDAIQKRLDPPFEDLFDPAEESVISVLFEAWTHILSADNVTFDKVELIEVKRHLEAKSKYVISLQRRGIIKERPETPDDPMEGYQDPVYDDSLLENIPEEFQDFTLEKLVHNRIELEYYRQFLADNYASMDLMCWMDIEAFRRIPHTEEKRRDMKAKDCKVKYFNKKYFFGPNSPAGKEGQEKVMQAGGGWGKLLNDRPPTNMLLEAQKYVHERLEKKWLPLFLVTESFAERQRPVSGMDDVVEDVMIQRKKKSAAIWKMLESKWVSSSKDILTFRRALMNPVTSLQFRRYVSIKGDNYENDVLFWQEVQRYKDLCHLHSDRSLIQQKTAAIINCFVESPIPPSLQIDITPEMADKIMERRLEATPYLFREAQLTVFRVLFQQWNDFCAYRSNLSDDRVLPTIERHRRKARIEEKKKEKELEKKQAKEMARRKALGLPGDGAENEDAFDPFAKAARVGSDDDEDEGVKGAVSWSYGSYMNGLEKEEVLNSVDDSTFASLTSRPQSAASNFTSDRNSEADDKESVASVESKTNEKKKKSKTKVEMADSAVQTDGKPKKSVKLVEDKQKMAAKDTKPKTEEGKEKTKAAAEPSKPRMARGMPPLVRSS